MYKKPRVVEIPEAPTPEDITALTHRAYSTCIWHLERSDKTSGQLAAKLRRKGFTDQFITTVLEQLEEEGYINDRRFAKYYIERKIGDKGLSVLRSELSVKGVPRDLINEVVEEYTEELEENEEQSVSEVEEEGARKLAASKARQLPRDLEYSKKLNRVVGALARRGFSSDIYNIARAAVDEHSPAPEPEDEE